MRPFFSYYGGKWRDTPRLYPAPLCEIIIEPFAGSAGYALRYHWLDVTLYDIDPVICSVWGFLLSASRTDILSIPDVRPGETVDDITSDCHVKNLVGFWLNKGVATPRKSPSSWMRSGVRPGSFWGESVRRRIADQLPHIRHWQIINASWEACPDITATWFVDPPYQRAGVHYRHGSRGLDYAALGSWCRNRRGQSIVCEATGADWLPFSHAADTKTSRRKSRSREAVWLGGAA